LILNLLRALLVVYRSVRRMHLILDNCVIQKGQAAEAFLRTIGQKIQLHFLPSYRPEENQIERLWRTIMTTSPETTAARRSRNSGTGSASTWTPGSRFVEELPVMCNNPVAESGEAI
jgi:hypothetical protein